MKVLLLNGSPHEHGCTYTALAEMARTFETEGVEGEIIHIGTRPVSGCIACGFCRGSGFCAINDGVNEFIEKAAVADGFVFGSPVYYASANGSLISFLDRVFYAVGHGEDEPFYLKPAAVVASARRAGTTATIDQLQKYITKSDMFLVNAGYWPMVHGNKPEETAQDLEGMQTMRDIARNMAWFLRLRAAGDAAGVKLPERGARVATNFIR